jgi:hypothetical protein
MAAFNKRNAAVNDGKEEPLDPTKSIGVRGSEEDMLVVAVPYSICSTTSTPESRLGGTEPNRKRRRRWIELNDILEGRAKKSKTNDSRATCKVSWDQVKSVYNVGTYVPPRREIDDHQLNFLLEYLSIPTRCFGLMTTRTQATRLHFIAPILLCVCNLFNGDVDICVDEDLVGNFVKAHGHFEFMLRRGKKAVCIVQAIKEDFEQGMAQVLVGCEVAADVEALDTVYGIVTNYFPWDFVRSLDDMVAVEECSIGITPNGPTREALKEITEKIYAMLT